MIRFGLISIALSFRLKRGESTNEAEGGCLAITPCSLDSSPPWKGKEENCIRGLKGSSHEILLPGLAGGGGVGMAVWVSFGQWVIDYCSFGKPST